MKITPVCPSCGTKLAAVEAMDHATAVLRRTCPNSECGERWQLVVSNLSLEDPRMDKIDFTFLGRKS